MFESVREYNSCHDQHHIIRSTKKLTGHWQYYLVLEPPGFISLQYVSELNQWLGNINLIYNGLMTFSKWNGKWWQWVTKVLAMQWISLNIRRKEISEQVPPLLVIHSITNRQKCKTQSNLYRSIKERSEEIKDKDKDK